MKLAFLAPLALIGAFALSGCNVTQQQLDDARASYNTAFLAPAAHYRNLGYCATGTTFTLAKPCADRTLVASLARADATIHAQFNIVQADVTAGNGTASMNDFSALQQAITTAESLIATIP